MENEILAAHTDKKTVPRLSSFLRPSIQRYDATSRSKRAVGIFAAAAVAAGLALGEPVKQAVFLALSFLRFCTNTIDLENDIESSSATQNHFHDVLHCFQTTIDDNFFFLGNDINDTKDSVVKTTKNVSTQLEALEKKY